MEVADKSREFMQRVVAWPRDEDVPGYVNLHWLMPAFDNPARKVWVGKPHRNVDQFLSFSKWLTQKQGATDIYYCTSVQARTRTTQKGKIAASRHTDDAIALKALWLDIDVKDPPKGYASLKEAIAAVSEFVKVTGLPPPSALIASGGGLHVYWISDRALTRDQWQPYAYGLKALALKHGLRCDAGLTTDAARVLRVPGTSNYKTDPPRPVRLLGIRQKDYEFSIELAELPKHAGDAPGPNAKPRHDLSTLGRPDPAFLGHSTDSLSDGLDREDFPPLDPRPILKGCAFLGDALRTGGAAYDQPQWNLTTLCATFIEQGEKFAHAFGSKHPEYTRESTDELWERKSRERRERGLGFPSCTAIQASGCKSCSTCPHFAAGKSPLNLALALPPTPPTPATVLPPTVPAALAAATAPVIQMVRQTPLPFGYVLDDDGFICKVVEIREAPGAPPTYEKMKLFTCRLMLPWAQKEPHSALNFSTTYDAGGAIYPVSVKHELIMTQDLTRDINRQLVKPYPENKKFLEGFFMAWMTQLCDAAEAVKATPFGWWMEGEKIKGFIYGSMMMSKGGLSSPSGYGDPRTKAKYTPTGAVQPWFEAWRMIKGQQRPELELIVAASFGAPLMKLYGAIYSMLVSPWGSDSGGGKSTSLAVGLAVWGHPKRAKDNKQTTPKSLIQKMGELQNLPIYWDEITDELTQQRVFEVMFQATDGIEGSRLNSKIAQQAQGDWSNIIVACSNKSMVEFTIRTQKTTNAGAFRIFEFKVEPTAADAVGKISPIDASRITDRLDYNFGMLGVQYARMLAEDPAGIAQLVKDIYEGLRKEVALTEQERFWGAFCACSLAGAALASKLGVDFDVPGLRRFMVDTIRDMRTRMLRDIPVGGSQDSTEAALTAFLQEHTQNILRTRTSSMAAGAGKPKPLDLINGPLLGRDPVYAHFAVENRLLRISRRRFDEFLTEQKINTSPILEGLTEHFKAKIERSSLGTGTPYLTGREQLLTIPVLPGSPLEAVMNARGGANEGGS